MCKTAFAVAVAFLGAAVGVGVLPARAVHGGAETGAGSVAAPTKLVHFNVPAQPLNQALNSFAQQADLRIVFDTSAAEGVTSPALSGSLTAGKALEILLANSKLTYRFMDEKTVAVEGVGETGAAVAKEGVVRVAQSGASQAQTSESLESGAVDDEQRNSSASVEAEESSRNGIPEILVTGSKLTALNMDIERTRNDTQPYVVFDRDSLEQSGALNLDDFFKNQLTMSVEAYASSMGADPEGNRSTVNLRGLGADETLILIDGHRIASFNNEGSAGQPDINGIPIAAIERIEVLPTTASGIYGGGATGGVINIILRRDYSGFETKLTYGNTFGSDAASRRADISGGINFSDGKANLLVAASYADANPLLAQERRFIQMGRAHILEVNPAFYYDSPQPPLGATTNIRSVNGDDLVLKNGTSLGSPITFVPYGYTGSAADGGAALVSNAGMYNFDLANTGQNEGGARAILNSPTTKSLLVTFRRELASRLQTFIEAGVFENSGRFLYSRANSSDNADAIIGSDSPNNPFQQAISVTVPAIGTEGYIESQSESQRMVVGIILGLWGDWRAAGDLTWSRSRYSYYVPGGISADTRTSISNGSIDVLRDLNLFPASFDMLDTPFTSLSPAETTMKDANIRVGGALPWSLPGGKVSLSALIERRDEVLGRATRVIRTNRSLIPGRSQSVNSLYLEADLPLISARNARLGAKLLDFQVAVRRDDYTVRGATRSINLANPRPIVEFKNKQSSVDPTFGVRYQPWDPVVLRASYGTGYLPPAVDQLVPGTPVAIPFNSFDVGDPLRGNERLGIVNLTGGGNPELMPERSRNWSAGLILNPLRTQEMRLSLDWSRIIKTDNIGSISPTTQRGLNDLLTADPSRITRGEPSGEFPVGPITGIDVSLINIARLHAESIDFALDFELDATRFGIFGASLGATRLLHLTAQVTPSTPTTEYAGVSGSSAGALSQAGGLKWKAAGSLTWELNNWQIGWITRFFDSYYLNAERSPFLNQGSNRIPTQIYHDVSLRYRLPSSGRSMWLSSTDIQLGIKNVFNTSPPIDTSGGDSSAYFSMYGDPRLASYFISVRKSFSGN